MELLARLWSVAQCTASWRGAGGALGTQERLSTTELICAAVIGEALRLMSTMDVVCFQETHADAVSLRGIAVWSPRRGTLVSGMLGSAGGIATEFSAELVAVNTVECAELQEARVHRWVITDRDSGMRTILCHVHNYDR